MIAVGPTVDEVAENDESSNWIGITINPSLSLLFDNDPNLETLRNDFLWNMIYQKSLDMRKMDGVTIGLKLFLSQIFSYWNKS